MPSLAFRLEFCPDVIKPKLSLDWRVLPNGYPLFQKNYVAEAIHLNWVSCNVIGTKAKSFHDTPILTFEVVCIGLSQ